MMKTLSRALAVMLLACAVGLGFYAVVQPLGSAMPTAQAGGHHGAPDFVAGSQALGGERRGHTEGGSGGLSSLLPVLGEFGAAFLVTAALAAMAGKSRARSRKGRQGLSGGGPSLPSV